MKGRRFEQIKNDCKKQVQNQLAELTEESKKYISDNYNLTIVSAPATVGKSSKLSLLLRKKKNVD